MAKVYEHNSEESAFNVWYDFKMQNFKMPPCSELNEILNG